jgi:predicted DsbA family dithiol-disulfide isomerase
MRVDIWSDVICPWCYVGEAFDGDAYADEVRQDELQARQIGINGVPFFVFDMALGASGAQSAELFSSALDQAWNRNGADKGHHD